MVKCCGPKLSLCLILVGVWGIIQLSFMGLFFRIKSPALSMDIAWPPKNETNPLPPSEIKRLADEGYEMSSNNCFVAAGIYVVIVVGSAINYKCLNMRGNLN